MRLKTIYRILKEVQPIVANIKAEKINSNGDCKIENWTAMLDVVKKIKNIELFKDFVKRLFDISPIFAENTPTIKLTASLTNSFGSWLNELKTKINIIIELCESIGYAENEGDFEVKLPETNDLNEFVENVKDFNKALQLCPFIRANDTEIKLIKTDIGSTWLEFAIKGVEVTAVLTALGYVAQSALKIKSMYLTCEQQKEAIRGAQIKNDLAENITKMYKDMIDVVAANEIKKIEEKLDKPLTPEERNSAEKSLDILGKLMSKGLEIYAALDSPPEIKSIFPEEKEQKFLPTVVKMLSAKSDDTDSC